ncbi:SMI1/KNR4 family protein [Botryobacter ruber]|uniref:SMI1/KNR4 family protein n=1 Tax=Botryobacter ruber TaxID=2171629 RepID=UPI000E0AD0A1|nr:SMI1/KNR4 family protein [Botryobacter ruber]
MENIEIWADTVIDLWLKNKIPVQPGASLESISKTEEILGFVFPDSFKALYKKANGFEEFEWDANMICLWSLNRIEQEYGRYPNFIGFGDYLINSHVYGFSKGEKGIFKNYDLADPGIPEKIAETFEEAVELINKNSDLLY